MFKVLIGPSKSDALAVYSAPVVEQALAFALELHRVSNIDHSVVVLDKSDCVVVSLDFVKPQSK